MLYFIISASIIGCYLLGSYRKEFFEKYEKYVFWAMGIIIFLVAALRVGIGYDFNNYMGIHEKIYTQGAGINEVGVEIGYYLLNKILPFGGVIFFSAILGVILKINIIDKYSANKWITLFMYFTSVWIMYDMGVIRQGIAMTFAFLSIKYILERSQKKFLACIGVGCLFHITIIFFIPLYYINSRKINKKNIYIIAGVSLIISFIDIREIMTNITIILPVFIKDKLMYYLALENVNLTISLVKRIIFLIIFVEAYEKLKVEDKESLLFLNGYILSVILMGIGSSIDIIGGRGSAYLYILQIFIFAKIITSIKSDKYKKIAICIVILLSTNSIMGIVEHGNNSKQPYTPYKSIFSESMVK